MIVGHIGGGQSDGYQIQRSLRLRASASAWAFRNITNTPADTDNKRKTYSMWCKRSALGSVQELLANYISNTNFWGLYFSSDDRLCFSASEGGSTQAAKFSAALFRDPTAWLHVVLVTDTANAVAEDRIQIFVNGVRITSWNTNTTPALNAITAAAFIAPNAGTWFLNIGRLANASNYFDGYFSEVIGVDGQALTPSAFGEFDSSDNWRPKAYTGTYGTNGFRLDFSDPTSLTTLMADSSGAGNNWTASNISLTAGATYDSMLDVPLGGGGNERGNYATLNPLARHAYNATLLDGNLTVNNGGSTAGALNASGTQVAEYPVYMELTAFNVGGTLSGAGTCGFQRPSISHAAGDFPSSVSGSFGFGVSSGAWLKRKDGATASTISLSGYAGGTVMRIAFNPLTGEAWVGKDGAWNGSGNPSTGANPDLTGITDPLALVAGVSAYSDGTNSISWYVNCGQRPFAHAVPTGFRGQHTGNLTSDTVTVSGSFTGNVSADGPPIWMNGAPETLTINGNAVTWGTHADKTAGGFKLRTSSASYNSSGSNTWSATVLTPSFKSAFRRQLAKVNP